MKLLLPLAAFSVVCAFAQSDVPGSHDHPLLSRFQGSTVRRYKAEDYGSFRAALGPGYQSGGASVALRKSEVFEGKHTMIQYTAPAGKSDLEIVRSYERALASLSFTKLYACGAAECGVNLTQQLYETEESLNPMFAAWGSTFHYSVWKGFKDGIGYFVVVCAVSPPPKSGPTVYQLDIVESKPMDAGTVTVNSAQMASSIKEAGHIALYGIHFDTNSAQLRPDSLTAIAEIAKLLKENPSLRLAVVGHTDTEGAWAANMDLSRRRAAAVVQDLVAANGLAPTRLMPVGVGAAAPVADNRSEQGRAKNRRVELVELP